ncbi:TPA: plasmid recombination protein [Vibrio campbellii]
MSCYQFIHVETYKNQLIDDLGPALESVVNEGMRVDGYCPHVLNPQRPEILYGIDPRDVPKIAIERAAQARDKLGRRIRKDSPLMLAGIASVGSESSVELKDFLNLSIKFLRRKYGNNLMSIILHLDEPHPHIHFYCVPSNTNGEFKMSEIHDGIRARDQCSGGRKKKENAYKKAMRAFQDEYYSSVSAALGMLRIGPKLQRLSRKEWKAQKAQASILSESLRSARELQKKARENLEKARLIEKESKAREKKVTEIESSYFTSSKNHKKNAYLRSQLHQSECLNRQLSSKLTEERNSIKKLKSELRGMRSEIEASRRKFQAMDYKMSIKDNRIQQLKYNYNNKIGSSYEQRNLSISSNDYGY